MHDYGWLSLLPPVVAIVLAIASRRILTALLVGVITGVALLAWHDTMPHDGLASLARFGGQVVTRLLDALWTSFADWDHVRVFLFTLLMGAMVGLMQASGGMVAIVRGLTPIASTRRRGQFTVWLLGLIVFFDDYANSLLLGNTMRSLCDRLRISREKLAYLVDSTAAPVSGLALVSTWVAGEIGYLGDGLRQAGLSGSSDGFQLFLETIPYRFYVLWTLLLVPMVALSGRDLGAMWHVERRALSRAPAGGQIESAFRPVPGRWFDAVLPVVAVVGVTLAVIFQSGRTVVAAEQLEPSLLNVFGNGDSYQGLLWGSLAGVFCAAVPAWLRGMLSGRVLYAAAQRGASHVVPALAILWLAWTLSSLTGGEQLGTGSFLAAKLGAAVSPAWMPTLVFLVAGMIAFSTGTSWGTMGILMPLVVPITHQLLGQPPSASHPILVASAGSVLAGAIFGDHCSPISDTTVLSSQASGCAHVEHVWTQLPYAVLAATVSVLCGTLPVGFGAPVWWLQLVGPLVLAAGLWGLGRRVETARSI